MIEKIGNFLFRYRNGLFPLAVILMLIDTHYLTRDYWVVVIVGFCVAAAGQLLRALTIGLAYIIRGGKRRRVYAEDLVTEGMFSHCRNPMYVGNILIVAGLALISDSPLMLFIGLPLFLFAYYAITRAEEAFLSKKFGSAYDDYCKNVPRFLVRFSGIRETLRGMTFKWRRLVVKEYGTTFTWLAATILLVLRDNYIITHHISERFVSSVGVAMLILLIAYGIARYLKKSKILKAD